MFHLMLHQLMKFFSLFRNDIEQQLIMHLQRHPRAQLARTQSPRQSCIIASLIKSAAVPCSGVLTAVRSAKPRIFGLRD